MGKKRKFALIPMAELRFDQFPKHKGHRTTQFIIIALNVLVFLLWQVALRDENQYELRNFMYKYFCYISTPLMVDGEDVRVAPLATSVLQSFSHQDWNHLFGNMFLFHVLSKRLFQLYGPVKFWLLYIAGSFGGTVATMTIGKLLKPEAIEKIESIRNRNQAIGQPEGQITGLGASDAVMSLISVFYFTFPAYRITLSRRFYFISLFTKKLDFLKISSMFLLPTYFINDFIQSYQSKSNTGVNFYAHVGGFVAGAAFYFFYGRPLKNLYLQKDMKRLYLLLGNLVLYTAGFMLLQGTLLNPGSNN